MLESEFIMQKSDYKITDVFKTSPFTVSAEIVPPRNGTGRTSIMSQIERLTHAGSQFLAVTKGAGGSLRGGSLPIAQLIKDGFQIPSIAHFTCRDLLPEEIENQLVDHHLFGLRNILALRGDPPTGIPDWSPREGSHRYAYQLVEQIVKLNRGEYLERPGFKVNHREITDFCIGVACYPDAAEKRERIDFFKQKVDAGAEYAISQMMFSADSYAKFLEEIKGANAEVPVLPGTRLLRSKEQARKVSARFGIPVCDRVMKALPDDDSDPAACAKASVEGFLNLAEEFRKSGAPGVHIFVLSDTELACQALNVLKR
jgi:methylenetetrahydrofolate reductase (NADPH)